MLSAFEWLMDTSGQPVLCIDLNAPPGKLVFPMGISAGQLVMPEFSKGWVTKHSTWIDVASARSDIGCITQTLTVNSCRGTFHVGAKGVSWLERVQAMGVAICVAAAANEPKTANQHGPHALLSSQAQSLVPQFAEIVDHVRMSAQFRCWLAGLDKAGNMLEYLPRFCRQFRSFGEIAAAVVVSPSSLSSDASKITCIEPSFFKALQVKKLGHKLMLSQAVVELAEQGADAFGGLHVDESNGGTPIGTMHDETRLRLVGAPMQGNTNKRNKEESDDEVKCIADDSDKESLRLPIPRLRRVGAPMQANTKKRKKEESDKEIKCIADDSNEESLRLPIPPLPLPLHLPLPQLLPVGQQIGIRIGAMENQHSGIIPSLPLPLPLPRPVAIGQDPKRWRQDPKRRRQYPVLRIPIGQDPNCWPWRRDPNRQNPERWRQALRLV